VSLRPVLSDASLPGKQAAYTQVSRGKISGRSVRTDRWRYTEWGPRGEAGVELYDHAASPGEYHNRADDPTTARIVSELKRLLDAGFPPAPDSPAGVRENAS
jgi:iduronate 2-sulfatase